MTRVFNPLLIAALCLYPALGFCSADWPNEPAGSANVFDCPFSNSTCGLQDVYKSARYSADAAAPLSPSSILDEVLAPNATTGGGQFIVNLPNVPELYMGTWWKTNPEFQGMAHNGNKMIFITGDYNNNFLQWYGPPDQPKQIGFAMQSEQNNCHVSGWNGGCGAPGAPNSGAFTPNGPGNSMIAAGSGWHRLEVYQKKSTTATSRDGIVRVWIDGVLSTNYSNVNLSPSGFNSVQYNHTWDGSIALQCYADIQPVDQQWRGRDCNRAWHHMWDHLRVSIPNNAVFNDPPRITTSSTLSSARTGVPYSVTLTAEGGKAPYQWFLDSASLPAGLTLNAGTGVISGSPTMAGKTIFRIRVIDSNQPAATATKSFSIVASGTSGIGGGRDAVASGSKMKYANGKLFLSGPLHLSGAFQLIVYELSGRKILTQGGASYPGKGIEIGNLNNGVYILDLKRGTTNSVFRLQVLD